MAHGFDDCRRRDVVEVAGGGGGVSLEQTVDTTEKFGEQSYTLESFRAYEHDAGCDMNLSNIAVTLAFLRELGISDVLCHRDYAAA